MASAIALDIISQFISTTKHNRGALDQLKATLRHCENVHDLIDPLCDICGDLEQVRASTRPLLYVNISRAW